MARHFGVPFWQWSGNTIRFWSHVCGDKLASCHGLRLGVETLRQWMTTDGLWIDRRHRQASPHQPRRRRLGEPVQIGRLGTHMVRGSWREVRAAGVRGRRLQPVDAAAVRCLGIGVRLLPRDPVYGSVSRGRSRRQPQNQRPASQADDGQKGFFLPILQFIEVCPLVGNPVPRR
jgi:hypothetical protein